MGVLQFRMNKQGEKKLEGKLETNLGLGKLSGEWTEVARKIEALGGVRGMNASSKVRSGEEYYGSD